MTVSYEDDAIVEAMETATWYEAQSEGLGRRFLEKWKEAEIRISADPERYRKFEGDLRKCGFDTFPNALVYQVLADSIHIYAVMGYRQAPGYWRKRLD